MRITIVRKRIIAFLALVLCLNLGGCTKILKPYIPPLQQGNVFTDQTVNKLHAGMSKQEVAALLGNPVLIDPFNTSTWVYIYTFQPSKGQYVQKRLTVYFRGNQVDKYYADLPAPKVKVKN